MSESVPNNAQQEEPRSVPQLPSVLPVGEQAVSWSNDQTRPLAREDAERVAAVHEETGRTIAGRYAIGDMLGRGGQATVFQAFDRALRRWVALKLVHPARRRPSPPRGSVASVQMIEGGQGAEGSSVQIQVAAPVFDTLSDLLAGRRDDVLTAATALGVGRADLSRAVLRSVTGRSHGFTYGPVLSRLGIAPDEFVTSAVLHQDDLLPRLRQRAPELFDSKQVVPVSLESRENRIDAHVHREINLLRGPARQPGALPLLDWGCDGDRAFMVFPLCASDLYKVRKSTPLPTATAVRWIAQAAESLDRLHNAGIVHADLKPHNLLLDGTGRVLVADFGLARLPDDPEPDYLRGTFSYMSPEQLCVQPLDRRTDIYSLGATLYHLFTGTPPSSLSELEQGAVARFRQQILFEPPAPLPAGTPAAIVAVYMKATARNPDDRYQTAAEFGRALGATLSAGRRGFFGRLVSWLGKRFRRRPERHLEEPVIVSEVPAEPLHEVVPEGSALWLRYEMLAAAERGAWDAARQYRDFAWETARAQALPEQLEFLWDACRVSVNAGDREQAVSFARFALERCRQVQSPLGEFVVSLLADLGADDQT